MKVAIYARILITLLCLLTFATSAECAWVLWVESKRVGEGAPPSGYTEWSIRQSFEQRAECVNDLNNVKNEREAITRRRVVQMNDSHLIEPRGPDGFWEIVYRCLPAAIDPRGPKGK